MRKLPRDIIFYVMTFLEIEDVIKITSLFDKKIYSALKMFCSSPWRTQIIFNQLENSAYDEIFAATVQDYEFITRHGYAIMAGAHHKCGEFKKNLSEIVCLENIARSVIAAEDVMCIKFIAKRDDAIIDLVRCACEETKEDLLEIAIQSWTSNHKEKLFEIYKNRGDEKDAVRIIGDILSFISLHGYCAEFYSEMIDIGLNLRHDALTGACFSGDKILVGKVIERYGEKWPQNFWEDGLIAAMFSDSMEVATIMIDSIYIDDDVWRARIVLQARNDNGLGAKNFNAAFKIACLAGHYSFVEEFFHKITINPEIGLIIACVHDHRKIIDYILSKIGYHNDAWVYCLLSACIGRRLNLLQYLINQCEEFLPQEDWITLFVSVCEDGNIDIIEYLASVRPWPDEVFNHCLSIVCENNYKAAATVLVANGADCCNFCNKPYTNHIYYDEFNRNAENLEKNNTFLFRGHSYYL